MKVKSLIALFIILFKFCNIIKAQSTPGLDVPIVSLHSPNVVELGKYGDYPVNPSTGVLPVDIPLYTIKSAKLEFPISLSYHASGIKVEQEASYVGLGWSLNASGVITRQVRDKEDERSTGGFLYTGKSLPDYNDISQPHLPGILGQKGYADSIDTWYEVWDKEPDIFNAFAGGLNAEFCLDNNGNFLSTIFDSLKYNINFHDTILIITDKTGTIYRFGKSVDNISACESIECTSSTKEANTGTISGPFVPQPKYPSSWFLTEIISADKSDTISFRYKPGESSTLKIVSQNQNIGIENSDANLNNLYTNILFSASTTLQIIDKIKFRNGWIQFTTATDRQDMDQTLDANALNNARITGFTVFDNQNNAIQKVVFDNNDYFDRTGNGNLIDSYFDYSYNRKSLKLNGVKFYDKNDVFVNDYKFQYDNTPLPPRNNTAQDYWGYYNGKANESLMPGTWYAQYYSGQPLHLGGDRNADFNFMKAASLIQMTYPTGGYSKFDYEPNYYLNAQQTQHKSEQTNTVFLQALQTSGRTPNCTLPVGLRNLNANDSIQFTVSEELEVVPATLLITFSDFKIVNSSSMTVTLTDLTGGAVFSFEQNTLTMTQNKVISQNITLIQDHTYKIEAKTNAVTGSDFGWCDCPFIQITLSYKYWLADAPNNIIVPEQAGGLRIKSITNYNTDNTVVSKKRYIYGDTTYGPGNVGVGNLITDSARNYYYFPILTTPSDPTLKACIYYRLFNFIWYQSNGIVEMGLNNGCSVFYSKVTELALSTNDTSISNGKTEYYYDAPLNYNNPLPSYKYRYSNWIYPTWGHNNLTKKIDYKLQNSVYERIHEMDYVYELRPEQRIKTLKVVELEPQYYSTVCGSDDPIHGYLENSPNRFWFYNFYISAGRIIKASETEKVFSNNDSLTTVRTYNYNKYLDISKIQTSDSKQRQLVTTYKYTGDLNYDTLINKNMISLPALQEITVDGMVKNGSILKYNNAGQANSRFIFSSNTPASPIDYTDYATIPGSYEKSDTLVYDSLSKNIQQINSRNSFNTAYLWSYSGQYAIAEVKNAVQSDIAYTSFEADGTGNWSIGSSSRNVGSALTGHQYFTLASNISKSGLNSATMMFPEKRTGS